MIYYLIVFLFHRCFALDYSYNQCQFDPNCWRVKNGCKISAFPFQRTAPVSCQECMDACMKRLNGPGPYCCKSAVYDPAARTCDLFAVNSNSQKMVPCPGVVYFEPTGNPQCPAGQTTVTPKPPPTTLAPDCPAGQVAVMVLFKDSQSNLISGGTSFMVSSQDECMQYCKKNQDKNGNVIQCKTAQFSNGQCTISSSPPLPNAPQIVQSAPGTTYMEKQCMPAGSCTTILMDPKHILVGYNVKTLDAASYSACLQACLTATDFKCSSGAFYTDTTTMNCILNSESATTQPDKYIVTQDPEIYFEPKCASGAAQAAGAQSQVKKQMDAIVKTMNQGPWTMWSDCDALHRRVRFRNCNEVRITSCPSETKACD